MMLLVVGLAIGAILGAALVYMLFQDQLDKLESQDDEIKTLRNAIASQENQREARLREATETLQRDLKQDYDRQLAQALAAAEAKHQGELAQRQAVPPVAPTPAASPAVTEAMDPETASVDTPALGVTPVADPWGEEADVMGAVPPVSEPPSEAAVWIPEPEPLEVADPAPAAPETITPPGVATLEAPIRPSTRPTGGDPTTCTTPGEKMAFLEDLGAILGDHPPRAETLHLLPLLGRWSRDEDGMVRQQAIALLGNIKDPAVISWLEQGRYDGDPAVAQIASAALERYKTYPQTVTKPAPRPPEPAAENP